LELIVDHLWNLAHRSDDEACWLTNPKLLGEDRRMLYPNGYFDLGVAHGTPGIIGLLARVRAAGIATKKAGVLLKKAVRWLLRQRLPEEAESEFSAWFAPEYRAEACRLAWCYGDAGIAAALVLAARCTGKPWWESEAWAIARRAAARIPERAGVVDAGFCHGSSGLAHIFNRFYHASQDDLFREAAVYWIGRTLQFCHPGTGVAGFSAMRRKDDGGWEAARRYGVLEGIAGVGLTLLAAISDIEPGWDRMFMVNIPPISHA
jgi:hypothetical protein